MQSARQVHACIAHKQDIVAVNCTTAWTCLFQLQRSKLSSFVINFVRIPLLCHCVLFYSGDYANALLHYEKGLSSSSKVPIKCVLFE